MEFLPVLDPLDKPKEGIWYSLIPRGSAPGVSVGHTCTFIPSGDEGKGRILIVGGANPSGSFTHSQIINLDNHEWDIPEWEGLDSRYEHCCFVPESCPQSLWVFGGAQQSGNRNCIQNLQLTASSAWSQPETQGRQPSARHGHVIAAAGSKIYIHGGMAGDKFHNDMFSLDTKIMKWEKVQVKGDIPPGVAAHSAVALGKNIYIFGGMTADGASNSMYRFNTDKNRWVLMKFEGDMPPNRLDHSMCLLPWKVCVEGNGDEQVDSPTASETIHLAFAFGGMDTQGVIHNDCVVTVVS
ncbi:rab9 effector protein with kelch motifs isoform 2-T2 [Tautogolabrus adspersus]